MSRGPRNHQGTKCFLPGHLWQRRAPGPPLQPPLLCGDSSLLLPVAGGCGNSHWALSPCIAFLLMEWLSQVFTARMFVSVLLFF